MIPDHTFDDYRNRHVLVMGLGSFGGGLGAVKFLVERGAIVTVTDLRPLAGLTALHTLTCWGCDYLRDIRPLRSTNFWIFPVAVLGSSFRNVTHLGILKLAI